MVIDKCERCKGNGWITVRRHTTLLHGVFEEDCPDCHGSATTDLCPICKVAHYLPDDHLLVRTGAFPKRPKL